jgi:hypothetical protein
MANNLDGVYNSSLFNLANWKLTLPVDGTGGITGTAVEVLKLSGYESPYFYDDPDGSMVFTAAVAGATTSGTKYARSELREMNGTSLAAWKLSTGGTMTATLKVDSAPTLFNGTPGKEIIGQIHGKNDELIRLYWDNGAVYFHNDLSGSSNTEHAFQLTDAAGKTARVALGEKFSYMIDAHGSTLTVKVYTATDVFTSVTSINSIWQSDTLYFKAGVYLGVNETQGTGVGQTSFYGLDFSHTPGAGLGGLQPLSPPPSTPPLAQTDLFVGQQNLPVSGNVLKDNGNGADTDPNKLSLSVVSATLTTEHGATVVQNTDGTFTYTPATGFFGADSFTYTLKDSAGLSSTGTVNVTLNAPPVAKADAFTGQQNAVVTGNVLTDNGNGDDTDPNGLSMSVVATTLTTAHGATVEQNADGTFTYTPMAGVFGADSFTYTLKDSAGLSSTGTVNITLNAPPATQVDNFKGQQNQPVTGNVLLDNGSGADSDPNGLSLSVVAGTLMTAHGATVVQNADGTFIYTPMAGVFGADSFTYTLKDSAGLSTTGTVNVTLNAPPVAGADAFTGQANVAVTGNVLTNDTDPDGGTLSVTAQNLATAHGTVVLNTDGSFVYTPASGFSGADSFAYTVSDGSGGSAGATVSLTIAAPPPVVIVSTTPPPVVITPTTLPVAPLPLPTMTGTAGDDYMDGVHGKFDNVIFGLAGNDTIIGHDGSDSLYGGDGNDTLYGYWGNDTLVGGAGKDKLDGGNGDDKLYGGDGLDTLTGGSGADTFVLESGSAFNNVDVITDFSVSQHDKVDVKGLLSSYNPATASLSTFVRMVNDGNGNDLLQVDRDGSASSYGFQTVAKLTGVTNLNTTTLVAGGNLLVH